MKGKLYTHSIKMITISSRPNKTQANKRKSACHLLHVQKIEWLIKQTNGNGISLKWYLTRRDEIQRLNFTKQKSKKYSKICGKHQLMIRCFQQWTSISFSSAFICFFGFFSSTSTAHFFMCSLVQLIKSFLRRYCSNFFFFTHCCRPCCWNNCWCSFVDVRNLCCDVTIMFDYCY